MTLTPHEVAVAQLASRQTASLERVKTLRFIKNNIIGNKTKKDLYIQLGIVSRLKEIISVRDEKDPQLKIQATIVLGSFAFGNESNVIALTNAGVVEPLLHCLNPNGDPKLIEAAARTLNAIYASPKVSRHQLFQGDHLHVLVQLMEVYSNYRVGQDTVVVHTTELLASILARCCETKDEQMQIAASGAIPLLMRLLSSGITKGQEAALTALAALVKGNAELARLISQLRLEDGERPAPYILRLVLDKSPTVRLAAATCLSNMNRVGVIPELSNEITLTVLPILVKMLQLTGPVQEAAPKILAYLIWESESMQKAVCDMDAIPKLASIISQMDVEDPVYGIVSQKDKLKENALLALAAISQLKDDCRKLVIEANILTHIVGAMTHPSPGVRSAACQCTRSLSRSVKNLRTSLLDAGIEEPLFKLLSDEDMGVLSAATATLCNIVLDMSPMRKTSLERGVVSKLVNMVNGSDHVVRLNAMWAIKNLAFHSSTELKETVMEQLGYHNLVRLLNDGEIAVQEQALNLVRNLASEREEDIDRVVRGLGQGQLLSIIEDKLTWKNPLILEQALYILSNSATGGEHHRQSIIKRPNILNSIHGLMMHDSAAVRLASVWVVINLTCHDKAGATAVHERIVTLRDLGMERRLDDLSGDHEPSVRERVKAALDNFENDKQYHDHQSGGNLSMMDLSGTSPTRSSLAPASGRSSYGQGQGPSPATPTTATATAATATTTTTGGGSGGGGGGGGNRMYEQDSEMGGDVMEGAQQSRH